MDSAPAFPDAFQAYSTWLQKHSLTPSNSVVVTCGDWDLRRMFPNQLHLCPGIPTPSLFKEWINVKILASKVFNLRRCHGMTELLDICDLELEGMLG